jgi:hypothetical protein
MPQQTGTVRSRIDANRSALPIPANEKAINAPTSIACSAPVLRTVVYSSFPG